MRVCTPSGIPLCLSTYQESLTRWLLSPRCRSLAPIIVSADADDRLIQAE